MKRIVVLCLILGVLSATVYAREGFGRRAGGMPKELIEQLQLTSTQSVQLEKQYKAEREAVSEKFKEIRKLHETLDAAFIEEPVNEAKIAATIQLIKETQMELADLHFQGLLNIREILTKEQFKKMINMRKEFRDKIDKKMKRDMRRDFDKQKSGDRPDMPPPGMPPMM